MNTPPQLTFGDSQWGQAGLFEGQQAKEALDELFYLTAQYRSSQSYQQLMEFVGRFRFYSPFNALLVNLQMPGATYVATPRRWYRKFGRSVKPNARPLVMLQPKGPVMFVFDVSHTEPLPDAPPLPREVTHPFEVRNGSVSSELEATIENAKRDGVRVSSREAGAQSAGEIHIPGDPQGYQDVVVRVQPTRQTVAVPIRYELLLNSQHSRAAQYATLAHELGHLYCGHLGTPNPDWWPDRRRLDLPIREFEAESVCYLVCARLGIDNPSEEYLAGFVKNYSDVPPISLEAVMKASGLIEKMGRTRLKPRKEGQSG